MINLNELLILIILDDLEKLVLVVFEELVRMNIIYCFIVFFWFNGFLISLVGRGYVDVEIDKEDVKYSYFKMKCFIDYKSKCEVGCKVLYFMIEL